MTRDELQQLDAKAARWIAPDALRELMSDKVQSHLKGTKQAGNGPT
jgi:hypothetical protein